MVHTCVVHGCRNRSDDTVKRKFFSIPVQRLTEGDRTRELSTERRTLWLSRINRKEFEPSKHSKVCSDHFISGNKADLYDTTNPDWAPSVKMMAESNPVEQHNCKLQRHQRLMKRRDSRKIQESDTLVDDCFEEHDCDQPREDSKVCSFVCEGRLLDSKLQEHSETKKREDHPDMKKVQEECQRLLSENMNLKEQLEDQKLNPASFEGNDRKVTYYTGLPGFVTLMALFNFLEPHIPESKRSSTTKFQKFVLVLMRLRLNIPIQDLAFRFGIGPSTVSRIFLTVLHVMYVRMKDFVYWPSREELKETMPMEFRKTFGSKVSVIIDCFEIFIERPSNLLARASTWSSYKHHNTVKYLIGITPQGCISFLSEAWGGRTSDKFITENSGFLNKLLPGDIVLADRGFDIQESVGLVCAEVKIPSFTKGKSQLSAREIENTRKIAHVRIHVERVIGLLRNKYQIVSDTMPIDFLLTSEENAVPVVDKIVNVCCALTNLCDSMIPFN